MNYPPSIEVYQEACDEIRSWAEDWLHQSEFDGRARRYKFPMVGVTDETIMLGDITGYGECISLVQEMVRHKLVESRKAERGGIEYRTVPQ